MTFVIDDIYTDRQGKEYKCTTAGTTPENTPFNPNNVVDGHVMWGTVAFIKQESGGDGGSGGSANYSQVTRLGVSANTDINIIINETLDFNKPPIEVLKYNSTGLTDLTQTLNTFDTGEATGYVNNNYTQFDGKLRLKTIYDLTMSTPSSLGNGYYSESDDIIGNNYASIIGVDIR